MEEHHETPAIFLSRPIFVLMHNRFCPVQPWGKNKRISTPGHRWQVLRRQPFEQHGLRPLFCRLQLRNLHRGRARLRKRYLPTQQRQSRRTDPHTRQIRWQPRTSPILYNTIHGNDAHAHKCLWRLQKPRHP